MDNLDTYHIPGVKEFLEEINKNPLPYRQLMAFYQCALMEVETKFKVLYQELNLSSESNPIESIETRMKSLDSILRKLERKHLPISLESIEKNLNDIAGVRIICSFVKDIYFIEQCILKQDDIQLIEIDDYIERSKPNGYRSIHLVVSVPIFLANEKRMMKVEIQLRTMAMDFWASLEHKIRYKKAIDQKILNKVQMELLACSNQSMQLDRKMQRIKETIEKMKFEENEK